MIEVLALAGAGLLLLPPPRLRLVGLPGRRSSSFTGTSRARGGRGGFRLAGLRADVLRALGVVAACYLLGASWWVSIGAAALAVVAGRRLDGRRRPVRPAALRDTALALDLFAALVRAGVPTGAALAAGAALPGIPRKVAAALRQSAAVTDLGGDEQAVWRSVADHELLAPLAVAARRSSVGGVRLASAALERATELRVLARSREDAAAARAGVAITAPLALCFLPAFVVLGLAPVVIGLITSLGL